MKDIIRTFTTPRGSVTVRPADTSDAPAFTSLRQEALRDNPAVFGSSFEARENCTLDWSLRVLSEDRADVTNFVAESGGSLLGITAIRGSRGQKMKHAASIAAVYIKPEWRGMGILDNLFEACFEWARQRQVVIIKLFVVTSNPRAVKAYQRLGFSIYGTDPKVIHYDGKYYDEYLMAREMDGSAQDGG